MSTDTDYYDHLASCWAAGRTIVNVEHDIRPPPGAIEELLGCEEEWCSFGYLLIVGERQFIHHGLGCTKFEGSLMRRLPEAIIRAGSPPRDFSHGREAPRTHPDRHWCILDDRLNTTLMEMGAVRHKHESPVEHLSPRATHCGG